MKRVLVINGPNLNMLGIREKSIYGEISLYELDKMLVDKGRELGLEVTTFQSNEEGVIVEAIHRAKGLFDWIVINPGAYTHTSVAIRDALLAVGIPFVEVHISNTKKREPFRHISYISDVANAIIIGAGIYSYILALHYISYEEGII
ncbi:MAG: type II 3-dehydroquinate dehydratase [candidate division WOR-3 bacterium]